MCIICVESATCIHNSSKAVPKEQFSMCVQLTWYLIFSKTICKKQRFLLNVKTLCTVAILSWNWFFFFFYVAVDFDFKVTDCLRLTVFVFVEKKKKICSLQEPWLSQVYKLQFSVRHLGETFSQMYFTLYLHVVMFLFFCFFYFLLCWWKCVDNMLYS